MKFISHTLANGSRSAQPPPTVICAPRMRVMVLIAVSACNVFNANEASATSIVALINRKSRTVVMATDCRVNRTLGSSSQCKIIEKPGCTAAIADLYSENTTAFDVRSLDAAACQHPGDLRAKAEAFVRLAKLPYEQAVRHIRDTNRTDFAHTVGNKATEVVFAGTQNGNVALLERDFLPDSAGKISVERFESVAPSYARAGYFLGLNGHIRAHVKSHPDWSKEDYVKLAHQFVEMEIEAHPDLAAPPISELWIDENGDVHWLDKGACDSRQLGGTIRARMGK
jgi:hypothetical protein